MGWLDRKLEQVSADGHECVATGEKVPLRLVIWWYIGKLFRKW